MAMYAPPPIAGSTISRSSFRDTRVANDFSPFGSVHEFNAATRQIAPSPFLQGVRPGSLHTTVANGTPTHRGIDQTLSRRDSMASFYMEPAAGRPHPHPDEVFSVHSGYGEPIDHRQGTPFIPHNQVPAATPRSNQIPATPHSNRGPATPHSMTMNVQQATPLASHAEEDEHSIRYGSLYGEPYGVTVAIPQPDGPDIDNASYLTVGSRHSRVPNSKPQEPDPSQHATHKSSFLTTRSKLSRSTKLSKKSGFSVRRRVPTEPSIHEESQSQPRGTPYIHPQDHFPEPSIRSEHPTVKQAPSVSSEHFTARPMSVRSIPKAPPGTFPFQEDGDDLVAEVWLPWIDRLNREPCYFQVSGAHGEDYWLEVDYQWTKMINGTVKFHGGGKRRSDGRGRGRLIIEWEIAFQFEP